MAAKKPALDYDPLSWLNDEEETTSVTETEETGFGFFDDEIVPSSTEMDDDDVQYELLSMGGELTIRNVAMFKEKLDASLANQKDIMLDPAELQKIDTSGLQLLYSLHKNLDDSGRKINWASNNSVINSAALVLGLNDLLQTSIEESPDPGFGF